MSAKALELEAMVHHRYNTMGACSNRVGMFVPQGVWFRAGNVCVAHPLPKRHTSRICEGHEDLSSCKVVLEAIKIKEKPSCVKMDF